MIQEVFVSEHQFWQFSVKFYNYKHNKEVLLELQDLACQNVNLILFACFLVSKKLPFNNELVRCLMDAIAEHDSMTRQFRQKRRLFKARSTTADAHQQNEYELMLKQELELEKQQQALIVNSYNARCTELYINQEAKHQHYEVHAGLSSESFFLSPVIASDPVKRNLLSQSCSILTANLTCFLAENRLCDELEHE